jgi:hypothetical protein
MWLASHYEDFDEREVLEGWEIKIARYFSMTNKKADYLTISGITGSIA